MVPRLVRSTSWFLDPRLRTSRLSVSNETRGATTFNPALNSFHLVEAFEPRGLGDKSRYGIYQSGIFVGGVAFGEYGKRSARGAKRNEAREENKVRGCGEGKGGREKRERGGRGGGGERSRIQRAVGFTDRSAH